MFGEDTDSPEYHEAIEFLYGFIDYEQTVGWKYDGTNFSMDRVRGFFHALGDPHQKGSFIHVTGTNGKGSTAAMIASALTAAGYRTGLYTSPHLISFRERIRVDSALITPEEVIAGVDRIRPIAGRFPGLTFFEVWTGLAFDHFIRKRTDVTVVEVGMGGRIDTTNVILPEVAVFTSISIDHRRTLGNTIRKITSQKAGIIKPGVPVVTAPQYPDAISIIEDTAHDRGAPVVLVGRDVTYRWHDKCIDYRGTGWQFEHITVPLPGAFQAENAAVAIASLEQLASRDYTLSPAAVKRGIETVHWPGRLQTVRTVPRVIVDGACNVDAMREVRDYLLSLGPKKNAVAVFGICRDKDIDRVIQVLGKAVSRFVFTRTDNPRAVDAADLAKRASAKIPVTVQPNSAAALEEAIALAGSDGVVIVTGSLYLVGELMKYLGITASPGCMV
ncbi:bifunctional folylpolyglutamate synthase/dihydrofolate synthase [Candidatus Latescibacterota bacterium]